MTVDDVRARLAEIRAVLPDEEYAHSYEDALYADVLEEVARRGGELGEMAALALTSKDLDFPRWCA